MPHNLSVLVTPAHPFAAHWALFLPGPAALNEDPDSAEKEGRGTRFHATGNRLHGFTYALDRNYARISDGGCPSLHVIGRLGSSFAGLSYDEAVDRFDALCREIPAPAPSLRSAAQPKGDKVEVRDCQWWIREAVKQLEAAEEVVAPSLEEGEARTPGELVEGLPKR